MKSNKIIKLSPLLLGALTFSLTAVATTPLAQAEPIEVTQAKLTAEGTITVTIPAGDDSASYVWKEKTVKIAPGTSAIIPAGATKISLPVGTTLSIKSAPVAKPVNYTVTSAVTLDALNFASLNKNTKVFKLEGVLGGNVPISVKDTKAFKTNGVVGGNRPIESFFNPATLGTGTDFNEQP